MIKIDKKIYIAFPEEGVSVDCLWDFFCRKGMPREGEIEMNMDDKKRG